MVLFRLSCAAALLIVVGCADVLRIERLPKGPEGDGGAGGAGAAGGTGGASSGGLGGVGAAGGTPGCPTSHSTIDCDLMCDALAAAACSMAPPPSVCHQYCEGLNRQVESCPEWGGVVDCMGDTPAFICIGDGDPIPAGCVDEFACFLSCE